MNLQSETHISSLVEELDFEDEANICNSEEESNMMKGSNIDAYELEGIQQTRSKSGGIKDEGDFNDLEDGEVSDSNLKKKETLISLQEELSFDVNDAKPVNKKMSNTSKGNLIDVIEFEELQQSKTVEIENDELNDLEEGEISECNNIKINEKTVCRYFKHGTCFFGSHCQFLHVSDDVYNMFNPATSYKRSLKTIVPCFFPPEIENCVQPVQNNKSAWEKGLENAKAMIQKAICKRIDDEEFENKRLYISSNSFTSDVSQDRAPNLKTNAKKTLNVSPNIEPLKANSFQSALHKTVKQKQCINTSNCFNVEKSSCEYKWVDPWMRSKSPSKRKRCKSRTSLRHSRKEFKRALSSSSSSSIERIYQGSEDSKKFYKKRSPTSNFNKHSHKSYSRSFSRSASRSSKKRYQSHSSSWSRSPIARRTFKRKRATSLEKWFKRRHRFASDSRSSSRSSVLSIRRSTSISSKCNSDNESWSSMTVSSITCSYSSSSSSVSSKSQSNHSKSSIKNKFSSTKNFSVSRNASKANSLCCLQSKKTPLMGFCVKDKSLSSHASISAFKERENVSSSYKGTTSAKVSKTLVFESPSSCVITKDTAFQRVKPNPVPALPSKPVPRKAISKDHFSSTLNCLLKYRSIADKCASHHATVSKPISPVISSVPSSQAANSITSSQVPDNKKIFSCVSRRTITLNLQPKSQKHSKLSEVFYKKQNFPGTVCNLEKSTLNRKETLLKQLKLIEDAISRKKK